MLTLYYPNFFCRFLRQSLRWALFVYWLIVVTYIGYFFDNPSCRLQEEREATPLLQLLTCQPPKSAGAVRFVSTGLCVLIACPQLLASQETERRAADWIKWLVKEEVHFSGWVACTKLCCGLPLCLVNLSCACVGLVLVPQMCFVLSFLVSFHQPPGLCLSCLSSSPFPLPPPLLDSCANAWLG